LLQSIAPSWRSTLSTDLKTFNLLLDIHGALEVLKSRAEQHWSRVLRELINQTLATVRMLIGLKLRGGMPELPSSEVGHM
jgi:hypothetical protein